MSPEYLSSLPLGALLDVIASDSPTPGGGSVSMISAAMGAALVAMAARISLKKGSDNPDINSLIESLDEVRTILLETAKSDIVDFHQELTRDFRRELTRLSGMFRFGGGGQGPTFPLRGFGFMR